MILSPQEAKLTVMDSAIRYLEHLEYDPDTYVKVLKEMRPEAAIEVCNELRQARDKFVRELKEQKRFMEGMNRR